MGIRKMKHIGYVAAVVLLVLALSAMSGCQMYASTGNMVKGSGYSGGNMASVSISAYSFSPSSLSFPAVNNVTVTWTNNDGVTHTVTSDTGAFDSGNITPGMTFSRTFPVSGTYPYHCKIHPSLTGSITVN